jgi:hypothetical protein
VHPPDHTGVEPIEQPHEPVPTGALTGVPVRGALLAVDHDDRTAAAAPATRHRLDLVVQHGDLLDGELTTDGEVVVAASSGALHQIEPGQVPAGGAAVAGRHGSKSDTSTRIELPFASVGPS